MYHNELFREEMDYFFVYIIYDYINKEFFFRAKELCETVGYRNSRNALRQCFPYKKKMFQEFHMNYPKIPHNSLFIDYQGALHLVNKSKLYILEKNRISFALHEKMRELENDIKKRQNSQLIISENTTNPSGTETALNPETASTTNDISEQAEQHLQTEEFLDIVIIKDEISIENDTRLDDLNHEQEGKIESNLESEEFCEKKDDFGHFSENMDLIKLLNELLELQKKNLTLYGEILKKLNL